MKKGIGAKWALWLATEAFHRMGYEPVFSYINWEDEKTLLDNGEIDCI